jgi:AcrR family transcriptional regulator
MPKIVDHEQRRMELAEAALRVVLRDGIAAATVRAVAAEAGWSSGSMRYYFATQGELRAFMAEATVRRLRQRVRARIERPRTHPSLVERAASVVEEFLPLDDERREEYALWVALAEWGRAQPGSGDITSWWEQRALHRLVVAALAGYEQVRTFDELVLAPHPDPRVEAWAEYLHVFTDGLAGQVMLTPSNMTPAAARSALRSFVRSIHEVLREPTPPAG